MSRLPRAAVRTHFDALWNDVETPPWIVDGIGIERRKIELLAPHVRDAERVVDLGCGGGDFFAMLRAARAFPRLREAVGVDVAETAIERARRTGVYDVVMASDLHETHRRVSGRFDLVLLSDVLYYLDHDEGVLAYVMRELLSPGGSIFFSLAVGRRYFSPRDARRLRRFMIACGASPVFEAAIDYRIAGLLPRRWLPANYWLWSQTHKIAALFRAP